MHSFLIQTLLTTLLSLAPGALHTDSEIRAIVQKVLANEQAIDKQLERFGYTETVRKEENGKPKDLDVYEVSFYKGRTVRRLVSRNGAPLSGSDLAKENERIEKQIRKLEAGNIPPLTNRRVKLEDLLHCSVFSNVREESLDGRTVWLADFHPNPQVKPSNVYQRFVHNLDGKIGVDPAALQMVSFDFVLRDAFNIAGGLWFSMKPGTHFVDEEEWQFSRIWLPKRVEFDMNAKAMIGVKLLISEITTYSNYREFDISVHDTVSAPKQ